MHFLSCLPHLNAKQASFFQFSASSILAEDRVGALAKQKYLTCSVSSELCILKIKSEQQKTAHIQKLAIDKDPQFLQSS